VSRSQREEIHKIINERREWVGWDCPNGCYNNGVPVVTRRKERDAVTIQGQVAEDRRLI
jgi:hypothetical protein